MPVLQLLVHGNTHGNTHGASEGHHKVTPRGTATSRHAHITLVARRVDSARWPNKSIAEGFLIPVINSAVDVEGRGVEQNDGYGSGTPRSGR